MSKFDTLQVGDRVKCVRAGGHHCLRQDKVYEVVGHDEAGRPYLHCEYGDRQPHPVNEWDGGVFKILERAGPW